MIIPPRTDVRINELMHVKNLEEYVEAVRTVSVLLLLPPLWPPPKSLSFARTAKIKSREP